MKERNQYKEEIIKEIRHYQNMKVIIKKEE